MPHPEQHFRWVFQLRAPPSALWPLVSNTDRFNRDCGYPAVTIVPAPPGADQKVTNTRRLRTSVAGFIIEWDELAFEWLAPTRYGVERTYHSGPVAKMLMFCELAPRADGCTTLTYDMRLTPSSLFGRLALPFSIGNKARATTERVFQQYDAFALAGLRASQLAQKPRLAAGAPVRLATAGLALVGTAAQPGPLVEKLANHLTTADDLALARIRPYALADDWRAPRRATLHLFLHATRAGLLDFRWDVICPHCRGAPQPKDSLSGVTPVSHCASCDVDFTANFDQSVELTFTPSAAVRAVPRVNYCVGGPQVTPHIVAQQALASGERRALPLALTPGRYRARAAGVAAQHAFRVAPGAARALRLDLGVPSVAGMPALSLSNGSGPPAVSLSNPPFGEPAVAPDGELTLLNATDVARLAEQAGAIRVAEETARLKGFGEESFTVTRVAAR